MKQLISIFLFLSILSLNVFTQEKTLDLAYLKCQYHHTYLKDTLDVDTYSDLFILQIGQNVSKWYSYYSFQADSLHRTLDGEKVWKEIFARSLEDLNQHRDRNKFLNSFPRPRSRTYIYKNYPPGEMIVTDAIRSDIFIYKDTLDAQNWTITDSIKTVLDYQCQMAECDFRGRRWTAWFTPNIPVSNGPWKLGGLPGMIMEAYDRGKQYYFVMIGLEQIEDEPILFSEPDNSKNKHRKINRRELFRAEMNQLRNGASIMEAESGVPFGNNKPVYRDLIERDYK